MTIKRATTSEMFEQGPSSRPTLIRLNQRFSGSNGPCKQNAITIRWWTTEEHEKFLEAMELYPSGPWKTIARHIGTRTPRQVMTHAQKYRQRIQRRKNRPTRRATTAQKTRTAEFTNVADIFSTSSHYKPEGVESSSMQEAKTFELLQKREEVFDENQILDFLLLDEVLELNIPTIYEPQQLKEDELMGILSDQAIDCSVWSLSDIEKQ